MVIGMVPLLGVFGFWLGEAGAPHWTLVNVASALIAVLVISVIVPGKLWIKLICGVVFLGVYGGMLYSGWLSFARAYNECVNRGEEVRIQLREYYKKNNQYPEHLGQLQGSALCNRISRPTILEYERTENGYVLSFTDSLVEHIATESEPFIARK